MTTTMMMTMMPYKKKRRQVVSNSISGPLCYGRRDRQVVSIIKRLYDEDDVRDTEAKCHTHDNDDGDHDDDDDVFSSGAMVTVNGIESQNESLTRANLNGFAGNAHKLRSVVGPTQ